MARILAGMARTVTRMARWLADIMHQLFEAPREGEGEYFLAENSGTPGSQFPRACLPSLLTKNQTV